MRVRIAAAAQGEEAARAVLTEALAAVPDDPTLLQIQSDMGR